jgi:protein TonB
MNASEKKHSRAATAVVVTEQKKAEPKQEQPKPPPPAPPKPAPKSTAPAVASSAPPPPLPSLAPPPSAPRATTSGGPAVNTGLTLSNDGPGLGVAGLTNGPSSSGEKPAAVKPAAAAKPPPPPPTAGEAECTEVPSKPEPIFKPETEYPESARAAGIEGRLVLRVTIAEDGSVSHVDVVSSVDAGLDAAAIATVQKWRFKPSMRCNKPVDGGVYTIARRFELGD